jgi:hypothetical protein
MYFLGMFVISSLASCRAPAPAAPPHPERAPVPVVAGPGSHIAWDQPVLDGTTVDRYRFELLVDRVRIALDSVRCEERPGASAASCTAPLPTLDPGPHMIAVVALAIGPAGRDSQPSPSVIVNAP